MIASAAAVGLGLLIVGVAVAMALQRLPTLGMQLMGLGLLAALLPLGAVVVAEQVFRRGDIDTRLLLAASASSLAALVGALLIRRAIMGGVHRLVAAARAVAGGDLGARSTMKGPAEFQDVARSFNAMASSIEELFDARREFVAWASHDLRIPLTALRAMLEAMEDDLASPEQYLVPMQEQVRQLSSLVDDLFELAQIDAGALALELRDVSLSELVETCLRGFEAEAEARRLALTARIEPALPWVRCDPERTERVLMNLLTNALQHTPSDGAVAVFVKPVGDEVEVAVEDTGAGIPPDAMRRVFDRFWRGDPARQSKRARSGLGLAIARGLVDAQSGRIWVENRPGGGARFAFTLPTTQPSRERD